MLIKVWDKFIQRYERVWKHSPPLIKPILWLVLFCMLLPFSVSLFLNWLLGFYTCDKCDGNFHVFKRSKGESSQILGAICSKCEEDKQEIHWEDLR